MPDSVPVAEERRRVELLLHLWWCMSKAGARPSRPKGTRWLRAQGRSWPMWSYTDILRLKTVTSHVLSRWHPKETGSWLLQKRWSSAQGCWGVLSLYTGVQGLFLPPGENSSLCFLFYFFSLWPQKPWPKQMDLHKIKRLTTVIILSKTGFNLSY